jgi:hypothetical protein
LSAARGVAETSRAVKICDGDHLALLDLIPVLLEGRERAVEERRIHLINRPKASRRIDQAKLPVDTLG